MRSRTIAEKTIERLLSSEYKNNLFLFGTRQYEYSWVKKIPGLLVIRDRAGIHAQVGEIGAPAFDEIIKWARDFDMTTIEDYYKKQDKKEFN